MDAETAKTSRFETAITISIAVISIFTALVIWRATMAGSSASGADRTGMIDLIKQQAALNQNNHKLYEEMTFTREYDVQKAGLDALEKSGDPLAAAQAASLRQMLPLVTSFSPMIGNPAYQKPDGSYDLEKRLAELNADFKDVVGLKPEDAFNQANAYFSEQRLLTVIAIVLTAALFWASLAQIGAGRMRVFMYVVGMLTFAAGAAAFAVIELIAWIGRMA